MDRFPMTAAVAVLALTWSGTRAGDKTIVLATGSYASAESARAAWRPIEGSPEVGVSARGVLELPCNFQTHRNWRVGWDLAGRWDLSACQTFVVDVHVPGDRMVQMVIYFNSGNGWYRAHFEGAPGTSRVEVPRKRFRIEGRPTGWDRITTMRLAIVRDDAPDRVVRLKGIHAVAVDAHVAIYRNDAGVRREGGAGQYASRMADRLDRIGVPYAMLDDRAVEAGKLSTYKVAILPLNPVLSARAGTAIEQFVARGGKLIVCYCLPPPLGRLLGVRTTGHINGRTTGALAAFTWQRTAADAIHVQQNSWIARRIVTTGDTRVVGRWLNTDGVVSDLPAVTANANGLFIAHVLTQVDDPNKDRFVFWMIGRLWPGAMRQAYTRRLESLGRLAGFAGRDPLRQAIAASLHDHPAKRTAQGFLDGAGKLVAQAEASTRNGDYQRAPDLLDRAQDAYRRAYAASLTSKPGELRAVWCHSPLGIPGRSWDDAIRALADAGFNAIIPNMLWGGCAAYKSEFLPAIPEVAEHGDLLAQCAAAGKKHGVAVHVWKVNWRLWRGTPDAFRRQLRKGGRLQVGPKGQPVDWLCPSHPDNQKLELDSMLEVVRQYDVAGVHFDYIRYPGRTGCYCEGCRRRFEQQTRQRVPHWPTDVVRGPMVDAYLQFRRDQITRLVAAVRQGVRRIKPAVAVSAAVFWNWPQARDQVGQDWKRWVDKGYLDFVCPMCYTPSAAAFEQRVRSTRNWVGERMPLLPGIGATLGQTPDQAIQQVLITRKHGTAGFVLFNYGAKLADAYLPLFKLGATRPASRRLRPQ